MFNFNSEDSVRILKERLNASMLAAAEPVIQEALRQVEAKMRQRLAEHIVAMVEQRVNVERLGADLRSELEFLRRDFEDDGVPYGTTDDRMTPLRLSELIRAAQAALAEHGDVPVWVETLVPGYERNEYHRMPAGDAPRVMKVPAAREYGFGITWFVIGDRP
jgi:hypothetical protein